MLSAALLKGASGRRKARMDAAERELKRGEKDIDFDDLKRQAMEEVWANQAAEGGVPSEPAWPGLYAGGLTPKAKQEARRRAVSEKFWSAQREMENPLNPENMKEALLAGAGLVAGAGELAGSVGVQQAATRGMARVGQAIARRQAMQRLLKEQAARLGPLEKEAEALRRSLAEQAHELKATSIGRRAAEYERDLVRKRLTAWDDFASVEP